MQPVFSLPWGGTSLPVYSQNDLHITDRKKDMIISGGFNVYPSEVEQVIWGHPAVQDCAVIGKERLGSVKAPKSIDFVDTLPRSPVGKVLKKDLRAKYWQNAARKI